jgi:hypothetical protein
MRLPLLNERADALLCVLRAERCGKALLLGGDALVEVALVRDRLDLLDRQRWLRGELTGPVERRVEQLVVRDDRLGEPEAVGLPVRFISSAFASPTRRGSRCVPPKPGMIPRLISGWPNVADSAASLKSQAMDSSHPPPNAMLLTAAMVVVLDCSISRSIA